MPGGRRGRSQYRAAVTSGPLGIFSYCANVWSILEYGSIVCGGAADTPLQRLAHIQHKVSYMALCSLSFYADVCNTIHHLCAISIIHRHAIYSLNQFTHLTIAVTGRNVYRQTVSVSCCVSCCLRKSWLHKAGFICFKIAFLNVFFKSPLYKRSEPFG